MSLTFHNMRRRMLAEQRTKSTAASTPKEETKPVKSTAKKKK